MVNLHTRHAKEIIINIRGSRGSKGGYGGSSSSNSMCVYGSSDCKLCSRLEEGG